MAKLYTLKEEVLHKINNPLTRRKLMDALDVTEFTIARYIQKKSGNLLKKPALDVIMETTHLKEEEIYTITEK